MGDRLEVKAVLCAFGELLYRDPGTLVKAGESASDASRAKPTVGVDSSKRVRK